MCILAHKPGITHISETASEMGFQVAVTLCWILGHPQTPAEGAVLYSQNKSCVQKGELS